MKIFEIGTGYTSIPAKIGAATEIVVEELALSMKKQGYDVTVVDIKDTKRLKSSLPIEEVYMPQFFSSTDTKLGVIHKLKRVLYSISLTYKLHKLIRKCEDENVCLHFHNQYNLYFFLMLTSKKVRRHVTIGYTVHSHVWFGKWEEVRDIIGKRYFQEVYCCQHADKVFVLNEIIASMLKQHYNVDAKRIVNVINGVNVETYNDEVVKQEDVNFLKKKYGLQDKKVVFQVGSVCDRKNQLETLRLLLPLMKEDKDIVMMYAGGIIDNVYAESIQKLAIEEGLNDRVLYVGEVSPGYQLNLLYSLADVAFMNSKSEAFALVIAEALSARRPIFINKAIMQSLAFLKEKLREKFN